MDKFTFSNRNIETAIGEVSAFLRKYKVEQKEILRLTLAMEDTLLNYRNALGEDADFRLKCVHRFGRLRIELNVSGNSFNVFAAGEEEDFSRMLLAGIGMAPVWRYRNGQNIIIFTPKKKKPSQMLTISAAILLALLGGGLSRLLPTGIQNTISVQLLTPVSDAFLGFLNAVAGIMIFLAVVWSICSIGDMATLTTIGKKMMSRMLFMMTLLPTVFALCILPLFQFTGTSGSGNIDLSGLFGMVLGILPSNLITPFTEGNFLQIIFLAAIVGIALLVLGSKTSLIVSFIEQADILFQLILEVVCSLIALEIFISIYNMVLSGSYTVLAEAYKAPLLTLSGCLFAICVYLCVICIRNRMNPGVLLHKIMPSFLIGLTTASSSAAMSTAMETCEKGYGIDKKIVSFGVPLGQIVFGIGSVIEFIVLGFCMAEIYGVAVSPVWIGTTIFTSVILKIATPPIPGGSVALCTILFSQLGLPMEGLAVAVAIDVIADFFITATDVFCLQGELIVLSGKINMLDTDKLRKRM